MILFSMTLFSLTLAKVSYSSYLDLQFNVLQGVHLVLQPIYLQVHWISFRPRLPCPSTTYPLVYGLMELHYKLLVFHEYGHWLKDLVVKDLDGPLWPLNLEHLVEGEWEWPECVHPLHNDVAES